MRAQPAQTVKELSAYLTGWRGYFGFCQTPSVLRALDEWLRRRLRHRLETVENWANKLCRAATPRRRPGPWQQLGEGGKFPA
ncbi:hypothetical protein LJR220_004720 [Bradyrhizobium sp. LjRoot220]|uniref:group II intron maturase-specific domain-containing protein n=1 Tax=Bradyrhizobium sp. LjRoot220 TaxID=3342284 RepID=UPI003ED015BC